MKTHLKYILALCFIFHGAYSGPVKGHPIDPKQEIAKIDSIRKKLDQHVDSVRNARMQQSDHQREIDNARVQNSLQQSRDNLEALKRKQEGAYGGDYKFLSIIGRYVIIGIITLLIGWWKKRRDEKKSGDAV